MIKILILILSFYSINVYAMGNWFNYQSDIYRNAVKTSVESSCIIKLNRYKEQLIKSPGNKYYQWKVKTWTNRCNKEKQR